MLYRYPEGNHECVRLIVGKVSDGQAPDYRGCIGHKVS